MPDGHPYPDALPPGHRIGNYEIVDVLGRGGFGITYRALQLRLDRTVAIKEYLPRFSAARAPDGNVHPISPEEADSYEWGLKRYLKEAKTLAQLDHPSIVRVYDYFEEHGTGYIVMEYIEGETLMSKLREKGSLAENELQKTLDPLMDGIEVVHKAGILHRDITPNNIMLTRSGTPILIDFGSARDTNNSHAQTMTLMGTPQYAAPEQVVGQGKQGTWTDIYGLSAVMFHCIVGFPLTDAFERMQSDPAEELFQSWNEHPPTIIRGFSKGRITAIGQSLSLKPQERPQTIVEWRTLAKKVSQAVFTKCQHDVESGDVSALFKLGDMYAAGVEIPQDQEMAMKWYRLAAEHGHSAAQFRLGVLLYEEWRNQLELKEDAYEIDEYHRYSGRPSNEEIKKIYIRAKQGHANSQLYMGYLSDRLYFRCIPLYDSDCNYLRYGQEYSKSGINFLWHSEVYWPNNEIIHMGNIFYRCNEEEQHEDEEAVKWYQLASEQDVARAQYNLGLKYLLGIGISQNIVEAKKWFHYAAERGHCAAQAHLGYMDYIVGNYTPAYQWCKLAAKDDHGLYTGAFYILGRMYYDIYKIEEARKGPFSYLEKAEYWYRLAAKGGHPEAMDVMHQHGGVGSVEITEHKIADGSINRKWIRNRCLSDVRGAQGNLSLW